MVIALAFIVGWLLTLTIGMSLAAAAKRGDELAESAQRHLPESHPGATIIPFERRQPCRAPIQCSRSCTISPSRR
jgi:hypothetical protein